MITLPPLVAYLRVSTDRQAEDGYGLATIPPEGHTTHAAPHRTA